MAKKSRKARVAPTTRALVVLSGGQDSTTCLYHTQTWAGEVHAVTFDYGQRHSRELDAAAEIARRADVASFEVIDLGATILQGTSPLLALGGELAQYDDHQSLPGGLEKTFVPYRNQLFLTVAANRAYVLGISNLVTGVCEEDFGGYPDCRRAFVNALEQACRLGSHTGEEGAPGNFVIHTPLMNLTKKATVELAMSLPGCYAALAYTHTSYDGEFPPVGRDHATLLRAKGFEEAGIPDPLVLRAVGLGLMERPKTPNYSADAILAVANLINDFDVVVDFEPKNDEA